MSEDIFLFIWLTGIGNADYLKIPNINLIAFAFWDIKLKLLTPALGMMGNVGCGSQQCL